MIRFFAAICLVFAPMSLSAQRAGQEIVFPGEAFAKLDTFEGVNLEEADKQFSEGDLKGAYAAYKAFSFEFARSKAMPYVQLRLGRCLHKLDKRNAAIKAYQDVVDYFPDDVPYAAAALYYMGEAHGQNGDEEKKASVWAKMVKDDGYVTQPNSGTALAYLGAKMLELGKFNEAAEYQWRTAVAFQKTNTQAADAARKAVISHYVVRTPNHDKLKEFYVAASGFDGHGRNTDKPEEDARYWERVLKTAVSVKKEEDLSKACAYWGAKFGDKFPENDSLRKLWADVQYAHEKDKDSWIARLEKQYASKPATMDRVLQWCGYFESLPEKRAEFFAKHSKPLLASMKPDERMKVTERLLNPLRMMEEAQMVLRSIKLSDLDDPQLIQYANLAANFQSEDEVLGILSRVKDKLLATKARFDYYNRRSHRNPPFMEKALAEIPALMKSPKYAEGLVWRKAELLRGLGRHEEAIKAYRSANRQPDSTFEISHCLVALKQHGEAVKLLKEIENAVGGSTAPRAAMRIAEIYRSSGDKGREVTTLRRVLSAYPKSRESSDAHNRLESYGVALTGGESEATK